jgi:hypothetical protein
MSTLNGDAIIDKAQAGSLETIRISEEISLVKQQTAAELGINKDQTDSIKSMFQ